MSIDTDALKAQTDIVAVIGSYVDLKKRGAEYVGICPFHDDSDPSLNVAPAKGLFKCFACDAGGDVIAFLQRHLGISFQDACEKLGAKEWKPARPIRQEAKAAERVTSKPPRDAPPPNFHTQSLGTPERTFPLLDLDGSTIAHEARYRGENGKKVVLMWTWGARGSQPPAWGMGAYNVPRPLYGLQRLALRPDAPVSIFEGPKKADAGHELLPQYVCISWTGGANAWHKHNLEPLRGRSVLLWPDADEAGWEACGKLAAVLADPAGLACKVRIVDTHGMDEGWDVADALEEGWDNAQLIEWAKPRAKDYEPPVSDPAPAADAPAGDAPPDAAPVAGSDPIPLAAYRDEPAAQPKAKRRRLRVVGGSEDAPDPNEEPLPQPLSEDALAEQFADEQKDDWRRVSAWDKWFFWDGDGWAEDREDARVDPMRLLYRRAVEWPEAASLSNDAKRKMCRQAAMYSTLRLAGTDKRLRTTPEVWDADPWMLGVPGGVVDLREGKLIEASRDQCITMRCSVSPERGRPDLWLNMLSHWTCGDEEVIGWLRRYLGYALCGDNREQCMAFFYGPAQAGKGTVMRVIAGILGSLPAGEANRFRSYHYEAPIATFMESRNERHSTELAALYGKRLITSEEPSAGAKWDEGKIKWITGGSQITARFISRDNFSFNMTGKIIVAANHRPRLATTDKAIRRRLHVVPFENPVLDENRDNQLDAKLRAEWPQILHWLIEGCLEWQQCGLGLPERISASTDTYLESEDTLGAWLDECCERKGKADGKSLYESYRKWCDANGEHCWSRRAWANAMVERGFQPVKGTAGARMYQGATLKIPDYTPPPYRDD